MSEVKWIALTALILFISYTLFCALKEPFFKSVGKIWALHWGRQVTVDLYVGLLLFNFIIYLNEGSLAATLPWLAASLIIGNPVTLFYFVTHFDSLVQRFF